MQIMKTITNNLLIKGIFAYMSINVFVYIASVMAIAVQTKVMALSSYGIVSVIDTTLQLIITVCALGLPQAYIRFYCHDVKNNQLDELNKSYHLLLLVAATISFICSYIILISCYSFTVMWATCLSLFTSINIVYVGMLALYRARNEISLHACLTGFASILTYLLPTLSLLCFDVTPRYYYVGMFVQAIILSLIIVYLTYINRLHVGINREMISKIIRFAVPLLLVSFGTQLINASNKYIVDIFFVDAYIAKITAAQKLGTAVQKFIIYPINMLMFPVYIKLWETDGKIATERLLSRSINIFLFIAIPAIFYSDLVMDDLIVILMREAYLDISSMSTYFVAIYMTFGLYYFLSAGLFIKRSTKLLGCIIMAGAILSFIAEYFIAKTLGFYYLYWGMLLAYSFILIFVYIEGRSVIKLSMDFKSILWYFMTSYAMYILVETIPEQNNVYIDIIVHSLSCIIIYGMLNYHMVKLFINMLQRKKI